MIQISHQDVLHLAQLSSLQLADEEVELLASDIEHILGYVEQLSELDTTGVEPTYQVVDLQNVWRDDIVQHSTVTRDDLLALAPDSANHQIKVPKVM